MPSSAPPSLIAPYLSRWGLALDGAPFTTRSGLFAPVLHNGEPALLKIACREDERAGAALMIWYEGEGAARVLAHDGDSLLLERLTGPQSLSRLAHRDDDRATDILCTAVARLHAKRSYPAPVTLIPLTRQFDSLRTKASGVGGVFQRALDVAEPLLAAPRDIAVLHGDIHHENVLDGGVRGWLAIDPKGLIGERAFDYCNLLCNPDAEVVLKPGRLDRQIGRVAVAARLDEDRLRKWVCAYAALSAAWHLEDGTDPATAMEIAKRLAGV